jgi:transcriptional regulator with XRE-family HTH domain
VIGERVRTRRTELGLTLRELAAQVDLTASFLSLIERDQADPSIKSLRKVAEALDVPMLYFLTEDDPNPVVRRDHRKKLMLPGSPVTYELLTPDLNRKLEMFVARVLPSDDNIAEPLPFPTEECILVLEGNLSVQLGEAEYRLEAGDSIYFEGSGLSGLCAWGDRPAVFVSAVTPAIF